MYLLSQMDTKSDRDKNNTTKLRVGKVESMLRVSNRQGEGARGGGVGVGVGVGERGGSRRKQRRKTGRERPEKRTEKERWGKGGGGH